MDNGHHIVKGNIFPWVHYRDTHNDDGTPSRPPPDLYDQILATELPAVINPAFRKESRKTWAVGVRALFKRLGLKGISVTAPRYSMAQSIDIGFPWRSCTDPVHADFSKNNSDCADCSRVWKAKNHVEKIILAAYPDLDNRSDLQSDYFDYCLSVH